MIFKIDESQKNPAEDSGDKTGKEHFKLMNNSIYDKIVGELKKKREVRIVNYEEKYLKLVWRLQSLQRHSL